MIISSFLAEGFNLTSAEGHGLIFYVNEEDYTNEYRNIYEGEGRAKGIEVISNETSADGKKDIFSIPKKSQILFDSCAATDKKLVWFEKGGHSHLRINNREAYDNAIIDFFRG